MQTFLTSIDFEIAAKHLDNQRLGKQRIETLQILTALTNPEYGWQNHPTVQMWRGWEIRLAQYGLCICEEWTARGYKDTCYDKIENIKFSDSNWLSYYVTVSTPPWLTEQFCSNHRSILLGKAQEKVYEGLEILEKTGDSHQWQKAQKIWNWYKQWNWKEQPAEKVMRNGRLVWPYIWPERV